MDGFDAVQEIAKACNGKITEVGILPDNSGFATMSIPLSKDHWIYQGDRTESYGTFNVPPMPLRLGNDESIHIETVHLHDRLDRNGMAELIRVAGKYAVRCATMNGKDMDFDPDALLQSLVVGFLGYWTEDGLIDDEWGNPPQFRQK